MTYNITFASSKRGTNKEYVIARLKRDQAEDPKAADPESGEYVKPKGRKENGSNATNLSNTERHSKPGTLRRLATEYKVSPASPRAFSFPPTKAGVSNATPSQRL